MYIRTIEYTCDTSFPIAIMSEQRGMEITSYQRHPDDKHQLCLKAASYHAEITLSLIKIRMMYETTNPLGQIAPPPLGRPMPRRDPEAKTVQQRFNELMAWSDGIRCYVRLHYKRGRRFAPDVPMVDEDGYAWFKEYRESMRALSQTIDTLRICVTTRIMLAISAIIEDTRHHKSFWRKYQASLEDARERIIELLAFADPTSEEKVIRMGIKCNMRIYNLNDAVIDRAVPDIDRRTPEAEVVQLVAHACRFQLCLWEATHGLDIPYVRHIFEVLAYRMEPLYRCQIYNLVPEFDRYEPVTSL